MSEYLKWDEQIIDDFSDANVTDKYSNGWLFTRVGHGIMHKTRSVRIDLKKFNLNSENRRVLKKTTGLDLQVAALPYSDYHWSIGKFGKDFYTNKFGDGTFSANKIRELLTEKEKSNFNRLLIFNYCGKKIGYCVALETDKILHYSYPFYELTSSIPNLGLGMMLRSILYAKENGKHYVYLGSFQRPTDTYKLQFENIEWFDGEEWSKDLAKLKKNT